MVLPSALPTKSGTDSADLLDWHLEVKAEPVDIKGKTWKRSKLSSMRMNKASRPSKRSIPMMPHPTTSTSTVNQYLIHPMSR